MARCKRLSENSFSLHFSHEKVEVVVTLCATYYDARVRDLVGENKAVLTFSRDVSVAEFSSKIQHYVSKLSNAKR